MNNKPWDARLAHYFVYPLRNSRITPNHLTIARLLFGVIATLCLAVGNYLWSNIGAICFVISNFLDHTDGELARLTNKMSNTGHMFDLASDALVNIMLFIGIGIGLRTSELGNWALPMGIVSGLSIASIFHLRNKIEITVGKIDARQPHYMGIEAEDVLYLLPLITIFEVLLPFLILATIGAPLFSIWVLHEFRNLKNKT